MPELRSQIAWSHPLEKGRSRLGSDALERVADGPSASSCSSCLLFTSLVISAPLLKAGYDYRNCTTSCVERDGTTSDHVGRYSRLKVTGPNNNTCNGGEGLIQAFWSVEDPFGSSSRYGAYVSVVGKRRTGLVVRCHDFRSSRERDPLTCKSSDEPLSKGVELNLRALASPFFWDQWWAPTTPASCGQGGTAGLLSGSTGEW